MPLYEYTCMKCGKEFAKLRAINFRDQPTTCPECHGPANKRVSAPTTQRNLGTKLRKKLDKKKPPGGEDG